ncbi:MAG TPA: hypothetical protein VFV34_18855 [Blastocatellia bacterium]|nr:hypothetical protein [Blastocatellia bacterium]
MRYFEEPTTHPPGAADDAAETRNDKIDVRIMWREQVYYAARVTLAD